MHRAGLAPVILGRALRLRCPRCGDGEFLDHGFTAHQECQVCGFRFEREEGYWTGAIYVNLITVQFIIVTGIFVLMFGTELALWWQIAVLAAVAIIFPILFYPFSKSIWLAMDHFFTDTEKPHNPASPGS